jgi:hypothetical protein
MITKQVKDDYHPEPARKPATVLALVRDLG